MSACAACHRGQRLLYCVEMRLQCEAAPGGRALAARRGTMCGCAAAAMSDTSCRKLSRSAAVRMVTRLIATFCPFQQPCTTVVGLCR